MSKQEIYKRKGQSMIRTRLVAAPILRAAVLAAFLGSSGVAFAEETPYVLTIKNHLFSPEELRIPAGKKVKILVKNEDPSAEEFESYDLKREKVVSANGQISLFIGPLRPGTYSYFGEFHPQTAKGRIVAEEKS